MNGTFVRTHYVSAEYHRDHPQLVHRHEDVLELLFFLRGEGLYYVEGKEYYIRKGSLVICNAGVMHGEAPSQVQEKESLCCVMRDVQVRDYPVNTITEAGVNPVLFFGEQQEAVAEIYRALHAVDTGREKSQNVCDHLANAILGMALEELRRRARPTSFQKKSEEELVRSICDYLNDHFAEDISMNELSERFHISPYYLSRFFKNGTGIAPMKYIMNRRIGEAQNMLRNTEIPIGDVGYQVGFEDIAYFSKQFKKYVGVTPTTFRANCAGKRET